MWIRCFWIYVLSCVVETVIAENFTRCTELELFKTDSGTVCKFKYHNKDCYYRNTTYTIEGNVTNCSKIMINESIINSVIFFKKFIAHHIKSVQIKTSKRSEINKDVLLPALINLKQLEWHLNNDCPDINEFISQFRYLSKLSILVNNEHFCKTVCTIRNFYLKNFHLHLKVTKLSTNTYKLHINRTFFDGIQNLEVFELSTEQNSFEIIFDAFDNLRSLSSLSLENSRLIPLSFNHFQNLPNLKILYLNENLPIYDVEYYRKLYYEEAIWESKDYIWSMNALKYNNIQTKAFICFKGYNNCEFRLDFNNRACPSDFKCSLDRKQMRFKIEYHGFKKLVQIPELPIPVIGHTSLYVKNANLTKLPQSNSCGYNNVMELHLANNKVSHLTIEQLPQNLTYFDIRNNSLQTLNEGVLEYLFNRFGNIQMFLSGNPWNCDCENKNLILFVSDYSNKIEDRMNIRCIEDNLGLMANMSKSAIFKICLLENMNIIIVIGIFSAIIFIIVIYFCYLKSILRWLYDRNLCLRCIDSTDSEESEVKRNDAFLAFSHKDLDLVDEYVEKLERGPVQYQLCFYHRDWLVGESIPDCIVKSIDDSKRVVILLTDNFVKSSWGRFEFRSAIEATAIDKYKRLIIILYPGVDTNDLDSELKNYLKFNTYLRRDDPQFWKKLMFGMPQRELTTITPEDVHL